ncbi:hypothetical protein BGZ96_006524 [Linnemannia gamsii]|uniref:Uncharacterized protein n=1 Tax=Linnemannia gamsii TaxID=64522 RepID=A0ABQ7K3H2_9FUNG|nr:hypothetical protein BGZ96_006524 [Linnemannia gamsii]
MENSINNSVLSIATDMDLDDSMPMMSPNMPLTTIPEFPDEDEYEEREGDISQETTASPPQQHTTANALLQDRRNILITRSGADDEDESNHGSNKQQYFEDFVTQRESWTYDNNITELSPLPSPSPATTPITTRLGGRSNRLSINLSFLSPSSPSSVSCSSYTSLSSASSSSPPSASYSSSSSAMSSPGGAISPSTNPFQWTSDLRQYIMTDIGPQPSNSQVPALRSHLHLVRQRSYSKIGGTGFGGAGMGGGLHSPSSNSCGGMSPLSPSSSMAKGFGMAMSSMPMPMSPTTIMMTSRKATSLQTQALVGQYGNGNVIMMTTSHNNNTPINGSNGGGGGRRRSDVSLYQQRMGSSSMTDLTTTLPQERELLLHHPAAAAWGGNQ